MRSPSLITGMTRTHGRWTPWGIERDVEAGSSQLSGRGRRRTLGVMASFLQIWSRIAGKTNRLADQEVYHERYAGARR